jgi:flagellar hook assembly protein FlgD
MSEHKGNTGKVNKVNLESSIDRVIWTSGTGCAGAKAGVEVNTHFVGNNSDIKIEISDKSGKVFETVKSKISSNFFYTQITVPACMFTRQLRLRI